MKFCFRVDLESPMAMLGPLGLEQICANCYVYAWTQPEGKVMLRCGRWDILHSFLFFKKKRFHES